MKSDVASALLRVGGAAAMMSVWEGRLKKQKTGE